MEKGVTLHLNKLDFTSPKNNLGWVCLKLTQGFLRGRFLNFVTAFSLFRNYLPLEKDVALYSKKNLKYLHPRMLCTKFGWNWLSGSWEEDFYVSSMYFRYFVIILPWKEVWSFNKLEIPSPNDAFCEVLLKLAQWFSRRFFKKRMLCAKFSWNWPSGSWNEDENVKSYRHTDRQMDRRSDGRRTTGDQKSSLDFQLRWAKKNTHSILKNEVMGFFF